MTNSKLTLTKTHDICASNHPKMVVVMIHGIASNSKTYDGLLNHLEKEARFVDVRFITFDLLGAGKSLASDELNYDYDEQLAALHHAIQDLKLGELPLVLVGHSLGTFIVTRYVATYPGEVKQLILISPPVYTEKDLSNPAFALGIEAFKKAVSVKNPHILEEKSFINSMNNIVLDRKNRSVLAKIKIPTTLIYGNEDKLIASYNIPALVKENEQISAIKTLGHHGVTHDKYGKIAAVLNDILAELKEETNVKTI